jgi:diadenosine tetraphosphate (Ap4A) HIT family hydrolase
MFKKTKKNKCKFCEIISNPHDDQHDDIIVKNDHAYAIFDRYPVTEYHILVIPIRHVENYFQLRQYEKASLDKLLRYTRSLLKMEDKTITGFNYGINEGGDAGQTINHLHIHLIPRRQGDIPDPTGGIRNVIPGKGNYHFDRIMNFYEEQKRLGEEHVSKKR